MSDEVKKSKGIFGWFKSGVSALVGAAISFGVTFGVITNDQAKTLNERLNGINVKAEQVVTSLKGGDINGAMSTAQEIVTETKVVVETGKEIAGQTKEKVDEVAGAIGEAKDKLTEAKTE